MKTRKLAILLFSAALLLFCAVGSVSAAPTAVVHVPTTEVNVGEITTIPVVIENSVPFIAFKAEIQNIDGVDVSINKSRPLRDYDPDSAYSVGSDAEKNVLIVAYAGQYEITAAEPTLFSIDVKVTANDILAVPVNIEFAEFVNNTEYDYAEKGEVAITNGVLNVVKNPVASVVEVAIPTTVEYLVYGSTGTAVAIVKDQYGGEMSTPVTWSSSNPDVLSIDTNTGVYTVKSGSGDVTITATTGAVTGEYPVTLAKAELTKDDLTVTIGTDNRWEQDYTGQPQEVTVNVNDGITGNGTVTVTYNGSTTVPTTVGTYLVNASIAAGDNYQAAEIALGTLEIIPILIAEPSLSDLVYNGEEQNVVINESDYYTVVDGSVTNATAVGEYSVIFALIDKTSTAWESGLTDDLTVTWNITQKAFTGITVELSNASAVYNGFPTTQIVTVKDGDHLLSETDYNVTGDIAKTAAGKYTVTVTGKGNYTTESVAKAWEITKAKPDATVINVTIPVLVTYDGNEPGVTVSEAPGIYGLGDITVTYNGLSTVPVAAGNYTVNASIIEGVNYTAVENIYLGELVISPKAFTGINVSLTQDSYVYDGTLTLPVVTVRDGETVLSADDYVLAGDTSKAAAGEYNITVTGTGNYTAETVFVPWNITKATPTDADLQTNPQLPVSYEYDKADHPVTVSAATGVYGLGNITVKYNNADVIPNEMGVYMVSAIIDAGVNYTAADIYLGNVTITGKLVNAPVITDTVTYTGEPQDVPLIIAEDAYYRFLSDENTTATAAGTYVVTIELKDKVNTSWYETNTTDDLKLSWTILPKSIAGADVSFGEAPTYNGTAFTYPTITVKDGDVVLAADDYIVTGDIESASAGAHIVNVTGQNNYTGTATATWNIAKATPVLADLVVEPETAPLYTYDGESKTINVTANTTVFGLGNIKVLYNGNEAAPVDAGLYTVNASITDGTNYTAADISIYQFEIVTMPMVDADTVVVTPYSSTAVDVAFNLTADSGATAILLNVTKDGAEVTSAALGAIAAGEGATVQFTGLQAGTTYNLTILTDNRTIGGTPAVFKDTFTTSTVTKVEIEGFPTNNVLDIINGQVTGQANANVMDENGNVLVEIVTWGTNNASVLAINADGSYSSGLVGAANITATVSGTEVKKVVPITVVNTTPVVPDVPTVGVTTDGTNTTISVSTSDVTAGKIEIVSDNTSATIDAGNGITMTVEFEGEANRTTDTMSGNTTLTGEIKTVVATYPKAAASSDAGAVSFQMELTLTSVATTLPTLNTTIVSTINESVFNQDKVGSLAAMVTAENKGTINDLIDGNGIEFTFIVPSSWFTEWNNKGGVWFFHADGTNVQIRDRITDFTPNNDGTHTLKFKGNGFSTYGIVGKEAATVTPPQDDTPSSSGSSGSSTWLPSTPTPTVTPTATPSETVPTDVPTGQPTQTEEPKSPGFGVLAVLAGLGAVAVLRRK